MASCITGVGNLKTGVQTYTCPGGWTASVIAQYGAITAGAGNTLKSTILNNLQILIGVTGSDPVAATLIPGAGISISNAGGNLTISSTAQPIIWSTVTANTQAMAVQNGYINSGSALCTYLLPATAAIGQEVHVLGLGAGGWTVTQNAGQSMIYGDTTTTVGTGGSFSSQLPSDYIILRCIVANTTWKVVQTSNALTPV